MGTSVVELCNDASDFDSSFSKVKSDGAALDKYYIPTRAAAFSPL